MTAPTIFCNECGASNALQATHCFACSKALQAPAPLPPVSAQTQSASANTVAPANKAISPLVASYLLHSRYSIVGQIGTGGFGAVYQAKDTLFSHRLVAIKEMSQDGLSTRELAEATAAFEREALLLADLAHPNLPRIHDHFTEHGRSYVVMDFIDGDTLEDYLAKVVSRLSVEAALEIAIQLCTVLDYLHSQQPAIIFRDLKPANIMLTPGNHVYLIDFGIARHFQPGKAKDTIPLGSKGYAAPEQYGKTQTTPQTDIYGLGATLHELLTGDDPSLTPFHFAAVNIGKSPISAQLNALLKQMVEMEMSKRPANMAIVKRTLQSLVAQQADQKLSSAQRSSLARIKRRNFVLGLVSVVAVCSGSSAMTAFVFGKQNQIDTSIHPLLGNTPVLASATPTTSLPANAKILSLPLYTYRGHEGTVTAVAWSPHGDRIASAGTTDSSVQVWNANTGSPVLAPALEIYPTGNRLPRHKGVPVLFDTNNQRVDALAWSSDSTHIAVALGNDTAYIWSIETGDVSPELWGLPGDANALAWSPDGSRIATVSGNVSVQVCSATTGIVAFTCTGHTRAVLTLAWSPDGKQIASGGADGILQIWDATTGYALFTDTSHTAGINAVAWSPDSKQIAAGSSDGIVRVWDVAKGNALFTYRGHAGSVNAVAWQQGPLLFSANETRIATGGADGTVQVWSFGKTKNAKDQQAMTLQGDVLVYRGHSDQVTSVAWSPDGERIASGSVDGTVQLWQAR